MLIANEYQTIIIGFTAIIILIVPLFYLILLFIILRISQKLKNKKFMEAVNDI